MDTFLIGLSDDAKVASSVCYAIHSLAEATASDPAHIAAFRDGLSKALLAATDRLSGNNNLLSSAYEALSALLKNAGDSEATVVVSYLPVMMERLKVTLGARNSNSAELQQKIALLQGLICGVLQVC